MTRRRYGRPDRASLLTMMILNAVAAIAVLAVALALFGVRELIPFKLAEMLHTLTPRWSMVWPMLPGAAIAYGCLWYWQVVIGRSRGVPWGGSCHLRPDHRARGCADRRPALRASRSGSRCSACCSSSRLLIILPGWLLTVAMFGITMGLLNGRVCAVVDRAASAALI